MFSTDCSTWHKNLDIFNNKKELNYKMYTKRINVFKSYIKTYSKGYKNDEKVGKFG